MGHPETSNQAKTQSHEANTLGPVCTIPDAVKQALAEWQPSTPADNGRVAVGDLRPAVAVPDQPTEPRIVLVVMIDEHHEYVEAIFAHPAAEYATDYDLVVPAEISKAAYDIVIQTDLRAVLWTAQLGPRIGTVNKTIVDSAKAWGCRQMTRKSYTDTADNEASETLYETSGIRHGTPLRSIVDPRWRLKEVEGAAARRLAHDCVETLLDRPGF